jgi:hypothetical protein
MTDKEELVIEKTSLEKYFDAFESSNGSGLTAIIGAATYTLFTTLGSGSYLNLIPRWPTFDISYFMGTNYAYNISFLHTLATAMIYLACCFFALFFATSLSLYGSYLFQIDKNHRRIEVPFLLKIRNEIILAGVIFIIIAVLITPVAALFFDVSVPAAMSAVLFIIGFSLLVFTLFHILYNILDLGWIRFVTLGIILISTFFIWMEVYRSAQKDAYVSDTRYCQWMRTYNPNNLHSAINKRTCE